MNDRRNEEKKVAAIVVTYNRKSLLLESIQGILSQTWKSDLIIIDNASNDGTEEALKSYVLNEEITYINTGKNLGGAGGFQYGIKYAVNKGYDYVWVMDDDSIPDKTALEKLMAVATKREYGFMASYVRWGDGTACNMNIPKDRNLRPIKRFDKKQRLGSATFVSILIPADVIRRVGLPIKEFFIWADDLEYTRRISRIYDCVFVPASTVLHKCSTNNGGNISTDVSERIDRYKYAYRNEVYVYKREGIKGIIHLLLRTPVHIIRILVHSKGERIRRIAVVLGSTIKGFSFAPEIEYP